MDFYNTQEVINFSMKLKELKEDLREKLDDERLLATVEEFINSHKPAALQPVMMEMSDPLQLNTTT